MNASTASPIEEWGLATTSEGALALGGLSLDALASEYGTPLHVCDEERLRAGARAFRDSFAARYKGDVLVAFAMKANPTPGIARALFDEGLGAEVMSPYEWELAVKLGVPAASLIVNGPNKGELSRCAVAHGALIVVDGLDELQSLSHIGRGIGRRARILLRINPDLTPRGMNRGTATGSRKGSVFGLDLKGGEVATALDGLGPDLAFEGFHVHIGTGVRFPDDYRRAIEPMRTAISLARERGLRITTIDYGGGIASPTAREFDTIEFLAYQGLGRLPLPPTAARFPALAEFAAAITEPLNALFSSESPPRLVLEPGRALVSQHVVLLVHVDSIKPRPGVGRTWVVTDGGAGTCMMPVYWEAHEIFLVRAPRAPRTETVTLVGPVCYASDWIYQNKRMPVLRPGDLLAVMDAGAYFASLESNFGFYRPATVAVRDAHARLLRRRETFDDVVGRDVF